MALAAAFFGATFTTFALDAASTVSVDTFSPEVGLSLGVPLRSSDNLSFGAVTESSAGEDASELNRELTNPVSSLWSIANQFNNFELNNGHWNNNWNFQPVLPVGLTKDWNLITRPVMPFYNIVPHPTVSGEWERDAGLGDLALVELVSPANSGNWILGAGPTAIFPRRHRGSPVRGSGNSDPLSWRATSRSSTLLAFFPSNGGQSAANTASPTRTR